MSGRFCETTNTIYDGWTYGFTVAEGPQRLPDFHMIRDWCRDQFGPMNAIDQGDFGDGYPEHWSNWGTTFVFMRHEHAVAFKMRWG